MNSKTAKNSTVFAIAAHNGKTWTEYVLRYSSDTIRSQCNPAFLQCHLHHTGHSQGFSPCSSTAVLIRQKDESVSLMGISPTPCPPTRVHRLFYRGKFTQMDDVPVNLQTFRPTHPKLIPRHSLLHPLPAQTTQTYSVEFQLHCFDISDDG